jgi:hypothetical protein
MFDFGKILTSYYMKIQGKFIKNPLFGKMACEIIVSGFLITSAIIYPRPPFRRKPESMKIMLDSGSGPE